MIQLRSSGEGKRRLWLQERNQEKEQLKKRRRKGTLIKSGGRIIEKVYHKDMSKQ